jgi:hypothetical protein
MCDHFQVCSPNSLQKAFFSFLSYLVQQLGSHWTDTCEIVWCFLMTSLVILSTFGENKMNSFIVNGYLYTFFDNISPFTGKYKKWNG